MDRAQFFKATGLGALAVVLGQRLPAAQAEVIEEAVAPTVEPQFFWPSATAATWASSTSVEWLSDELMPRIVSG